MVRYIANGRPWPDAQVDELMDRQRRHWLDHGFGWYAALDRRRGDGVGVMALLLTDATAGVAEGEHEIGWWIDPPLWGRGLAREGAAALAGIAFGEGVGARSVIARIQPANSASIRVAEAIGMTFEAETTGRFGEPIRVFRRFAA